MEYEGRNEERVIFNDAINAIYYRLYDIGDMVKKKKIKKKK